MANNKGVEDEAFHWIKSGSESKSNSIHSTPPKAPKPQVKPTNTKLSNDFESAKAGLKEGWRRITFIVREENVKKIKSLAYWERKGIKEVVDEALSSYLANKEIKDIE